MVKRTKDVDMNRKNWRRDSLQKNGWMGVRSKVVLVNEMQNEFEFLW